MLGKNTVTQKENIFDGLITGFHRTERTLNFKISLYKLSNLQHTKKIIENFKRWNNIKQFNLCVAEL